MSNENPTVQELADIVSQINDDLSDVIYHSGTGTKYELLESQPICELITDGYTSHIKLLGFHIWNSEDDARPNLTLIDEEVLEETPIITSEGEEARMDMKGWLLGQIKGVNCLVGDFLREVC